MAKRIEEAVEAIVQEIVQDSDLEVVDVEYVKERDWYLRIYLDKEGGIEIDDCQRISEALEQILDEKDLLKDAYILEVSSPGLDRVLKKARDFEREQGKDVEVTFYAPVDGKKTWVGTLTGYDREKNAIVLDGEKELPLEKTAQVRLHIDF
ncbi:ribosome maturation factor RimP [uncultured Selenomonas sp.]|uniref:ribosome maturation factor RimP n=1 Tax=uncultured Selenomonas sp. TaxID=159275 RepID=UPI002634E401|nr:ribosome maturation factor RimP [uncultured Selenomonas sp.]